MQGATDRQEEQDGWRQSKAVRESWQRQPQRQQQVHSLRHCRQLDSGNEGDAPANAPFGSRSHSMRRRGIVRIA